MEWSRIKSLLLLMSSSLGVFNKFPKQTLLSSSFDSLRSLNVYMSLPRHLTCLFFILLLVMANVELKVGHGRYGILVSHILQSQKLDPKRKTNHTIRSRCARAWIVMDGMETPFV